ncbi:CIS tube protein [Sorangium sp. So ce1182]|uniref:CIS tube protein n=1 Tax=Sorangium sp. So ce1182 TaxID=3133334 RepID=UPI003F63BD0C
MTQLASAALIPFNEQGKLPDDIEKEKIVLDFNPDTLTIKVTNTLEQEQAQKNLPRRQFVASTSSTLSFDAVFDSTHPSKQPGGSQENDTPERLDVRKRTERLAKLLRVDEKAKKPAPRRVRFLWGSIVFDGVMDTYSEVLEYFSPEGVPLRSKVSISLKEQKFEYQIEKQRAVFAGSGSPGSGPGAGRATGAGTGSRAGLSEDAPLGGGPLGLSFGEGFSADLDVGFSADLGVGFSADLGVGFSADLGAGASVGLDLGVGVDLGFSAGASIGMSIDAAVEVFGGAAVEVETGGGVDLGASARGSVRAQAGAIPKGGQAPWAPAGPVAGSRAAALAAIVHGQRASGPPPDRTPPGGSFTATRVAPRAADTPVPVRGSPPRLASAVGSPGVGVVFGKARGRPVERASLSGGRPRWEELGADEHGATGGKEGAAGACCPACERASWGRPAAAPCRSCGGRSR